MSVAVAGSKATPTDLKQTLKLFKAVGEAVSITGEDLLDAVTALSGSGPAFVYLFAESLIEGGVRGGLPQNLATQLAYATLGGAAAMLGESGLSARELRDMVISPGRHDARGARRARAASLPRGGDHGGGDRHATGARAGSRLRIGVVGIRPADSSPWASRSSSTRAPHASTSGSCHRRRRALVGEPRSQQPDRALPSRRDRPGALPGAPDAAVRLSPAASTSRRSWCMLAIQFVQIFVVQSLYELALRIAAAIPGSVPLALTPWVIPDARRQRAARPRPAGRVARRPRGTARRRARPPGRRAPGRRCRQPRGPGGPRRGARTCDTIGRRADVSGATGRDKRVLVHGPRSPRPSRGGSRRISGFDRTGAGD